MAAYVVMEPPARQSQDARDRAVFIRDGFSLLAFLVPPLWLLWHRLWIEALLALGLSVTLAALGEAVGLGLLAAGLSLLVSVYVGLEGPALRLAALRRRGWLETGLIEAGSRDEAEIRLFAGAEPQAAPQAPHAALPAGAPRQVRQGPALGLLDYPGR